MIFTKNEEWVKLVENNEDQIVRKIEELFFLTGGCVSSQANIELYLMYDGSMFSISNSDKSALPICAYEGDATKIFEIENNFLSCAYCNNNKCKWRDTEKLSESEIRKQYIPKRDELLGEIYYLIDLYEPIEPDIQPTKLIASINFGIKTV